jgi:multisubunit Na+/H+ antiporter MnhG subunit
MFAAVFGFFSLSSFFSIFGTENNESLLAAIIVAAFYFLLTAAGLFSVYRANKKENSLNKKQND